MKTKTILTLLTLTLAQSASAVTVNAALNSSAAVSAPTPTAMPASSSTTGLTVGADVKARTDSVTVGASSSVDTDLDSDVEVASGTEVLTMDSSANTVDSVDTTSDTKVTVTYRRPAKLFGFIPVHIKERATIKVEDDGTRTAEVSRSWWSFMATSETKTEEFLTLLKARMTGSAGVHEDTELTASEKTQYVSEINAAADAAYSN